MTARTPTASSTSNLSCFDLADLQGDWLTIEGRRAGELFISGQTFTLRFLDRTFYKGTFELHTDQMPRAMVMHVEDGPPKHKGKTAWCVYELEIGMLRWCPTEPGSDERLTEFPGMEDQRYLSTVFRRDIVDPD
jgi:uncharacterized protein (TIGR03067 family)